MADFIVTTLFDEVSPGFSIAAPGGNGLSLREAISLAEATPGADTITFAQSLSGGTIFIDAFLLQFTFNDGQDVLVDGDLNNDGIADITLSGDQTRGGLDTATTETRILDVFSGANVTLEGLILDRGSDVGVDDGLSVSTLINFGHLTLTNTDITNAVARPAPTIVNQPSVEPGMTGEFGTPGARGFDGRIGGSPLFPFEFPATDGGNGTDGGDGTDALLPGVDGANGGSVTHVLNFGTLSLNNVKLLNSQVIGNSAAFGGNGGNGGNGGDGGRGGNGGTPATFNSPAGSGGGGGNGGNGGNGTNGGAGGNGGDVASIINLGTISADNLTFLTNSIRGSDGGNGGIAGAAGAAGQGGIGGFPGGFNGGALPGSSGSDGLRGNTGGGGRGGDGGDSAAILNVAFGSLTGNAVFANGSSIVGASGGLGGSGGAGNSIAGMDGDTGLVINRDSGNSDGFTTNSEPVAADDDFTTDQNTTVTGNLFADNGNGIDIDADSDTITIFSVSEINRPDGPPFTFLNDGALASFGAFTVAPNGDYTFDPSASLNTLVLAEGQTATQTFFYRVTDGVTPQTPLLEVNPRADFGALSGVTGRVTFTIEGRNDAPVDGDENVTLIADSDALSVNVNLLDNATDVDNGDTLQLNNAIGFSEPTLPSGVQASLSVNRASGFAQWSLSGDLSVLYIDENLTFAYTYEVLDSTGGFNLTTGTDSSTLRIIVNGTNNRPVAVDDQFSVDAGERITGNLFVDLGNGADTDIDGDALTIFSVAEANRSDNSLLLTSAGFEVAFGTLSVDENGNFSLNTTGNGSAIALGEGETGTLTFFYRVTDLDTAGEPVLGALNPIAPQNATDSTGRVQITVAGVNDGPTAMDDAASTDEDTTTSGNVLVDNGNGADSDPDTNDVLMVSEVNGVAALVGAQFELSSGALLTLNADGTFDYDPNGVFEFLDDNETGTDSFSYTIDDGNDGTGQATVTLTVNGINDRPIAQDDDTTIDEDNVLTGNLFVDNGNGIDADAEGDDFIVFSVAEMNRADDQGFFGSLGQVSQLGIFQVNANGDFTFDPTGNNGANALGVGETAIQTFIYRISDETPPSEPFLLGPDLANFSQNDSIGRINITVTGVNDAPEATDDNGSTVSEDGPSITINLTANDIDVDTNDDVEIGNINTDNTLGSVIINPDNDSVTYDPNGAFEFLAVGETATDSFTYIADDGNGDSDTGTVTVTINGENDAPTDDDEILMVDEDGPAVTGNLLDNAFDPDVSDVLTVGDISSVTPGGTVSILSDGSYSFDPGTDFNTLRQGQTASVAFDYTVFDGNGSSVDSTVSVTVNGSNDTPTAINDSEAATAEDMSVIIDVLANDTDPDTGEDPTFATTEILVGDTLSVAMINGNAVMLGDSALLESGARVTLLADGTLDYDPNGGLDSLRFGDSLVDSFDYTITDDFGALSTATVSVTVAGRGTSVPDNIREMITETNSRPEIPGSSIRSFGSDGDDVISGGTRADVIFGRDGDDRIVANNGNDTVLGDAGNDTLIGGGGRDVLLGGDDNDNVDGGGGNDILLGGSGKDTIQGRNGSDDIDDGAGNDRVFAGNGNDTVFLNMGNDVINLGGGADLVVAQGSGFGRDTINDFRQGQGDQLDLRLLGIESLADASGILSQRGNFAVFDFGDGDMIRLRGINVDDLTDAAFVAGAPAMVSASAFAVRANTPAFADAQETELMISLQDDLWVF